MPVKYLGSKRVLLPWVVRAIEALAPRGTVLDLFSGTSRVGHALKRRGYRVLANDVTAFAATFARCYVQADRETWGAEAARLLGDLAALPGEPGWFTATYAVASRYVQPKNAARIDAIREAIARMRAPPELEAVLLTSLVEAADRVDSTTGVQMAYLKEWAPRSHRDLVLEVPDLLPRAAAGPGEAHHLDALDAVERLEADVAYLDPPYNGHSYLGNYHLWESLVLWDKPEVYGRAKKRVDIPSRTSPFNHRTRVHAALRRVIERVRARHLVVSLSDEGFVTPGELRAMLVERGEVVVLAMPHRRYVGAQIGIYDPQGRKVGTPGPRQNVEHLFVASPDGVPPALRAASG